MNDMAITKRLRRWRRSISPIWLVPIIAVLIGLWMLFHTLAQRGPEITLIMHSAESIDTGTKIRTRSVEIGQIESVTLSKDASHVILKARMRNNAAYFLGQNARFWVVKPRIGRNGISGLNTLFSGAFIELMPDTHSKVHPAVFDVLDTPPIADSSAGGLRIKLVSRNGDNLTVNDPVIFKGYTVGRVEATHFDTKERQIYYDIYIFQPFKTLVTQNTHFWVTSGFSLAVNSEGIKFNVGSIGTLLNGGITFNVATGVDPGLPAIEDSQFELFSTQEQAIQGSYNQFLRYVILLEDSIRGLTVGAPVEYRGVRVGSVEAVPWRINRLDDNHLTGFRIPILIRLEPQRLQPVVTQKDLESIRNNINIMIKNGLRANLANANLVTGALYVNLDFVKNSKVDLHAIKQFEGITILPSVPGSFGQITGKISELLNKLNKLDYQKFSQQLTNNLASSSVLLKALTDTTQLLNQVLRQPETQQLPQKLLDSLSSLAHTLRDYDQRGPMYQQLQDSLIELNQLLQNLQPAVRAISNKPNALIFNRSDRADPQPRAHQ